MKNSIILYELAQSLKITFSEFKNFLAENGFENLISQRYVSQEDILVLLKAYKDKNNIENKAWPLPNWLRSKSEIWSKTLVEMYSNEVAHPASLPPSQGEILRDLVLDAQPVTVVEIGCFIGISSIWMGSALQELGRGHLYAADLFHKKMPALPWHVGFLENPLKYAQEHVKKAGLNDYIKFIKTPSGLFGKNFRNYVTEKIDFIFIDGDHSIGGCIDDFVTFYPHIKEGGVILLHDIYPQSCGWKGPRHLLDLISNQTSFFDVKEIRTEPNFGMALVTKLKHSTSFEPCGNVRIEMIRKLHSAKTAIEYSRVYRDHLRHFLYRIMG